MNIAGTRQVCRKANIINNTRFTLQLFNRSSSVEHSPFASTNATVCSRDVSDLDDAGEMRQREGGRRRGGGRTTAVASTGVYRGATRRCQIQRHLHGDAVQRTSIKRCERDLSGKSRSFLSPASVTRTVVPTSITPWSCNDCTASIAPTDLDWRRRRPLAAKSAPPPPVHQIFPGRGKTDAGRTAGTPAAPRWPCPADAIMKNHCEPLWLVRQLVGFRRRRHWAYQSVDGSGNANCPARPDNAYCRAIRRDKWALVASTGELHGQISGDLSPRERRHTNSVVLIVYYLLN